MAPKKRAKSTKSSTVGDEKEASEVVGGNDGTQGPESSSSSSNVANKGSGVGDDANQSSYPAVVSSSLMETETSPKSSSKNLYAHSTVRKVITYYFNMKMHQKLNTISFTGKRNVRKVAQNFGIINEYVGKKLLSCIEKLFFSLSDSQTPRFLNVLLVDCQISCTTLDSFKGSLRFLKKLDLSGNALGSTGANLLGQTLETNKCLEILNLSDTQLLDISVSQMRVHGALDLEGFRSLMFALAVNATLTSLDISNNFIGGTKTSSSPRANRSYGHDFGYHALEEYGADSMKIIVYYLAVNRTIQELNILGNGFDDNMSLASTILKALKTHPTCTSLCGSVALRNASPSLPTARAAHPFSILTSSRLPTLSFNNKCLAPFEGRLLGAEKSLFRGIVVLDLSENSQLGEGLAYLWESLSVSGNLSKLSVRELILRKVGATSLCIAGLLGTLNHAPIMRLDLSDNAALGDEGTSRLSIGLASNRSLTTLKLRNVGMTDVGAGSIGTLLEKNAILTSLDLGSNPVSCEGVAALQGALSANKTLTSLTLSNSNINSKGALLFAPILRASSLKQLDLSSNTMCGRRSDNTFDPRSVITMSAILATNTCLTCLNLSKSDIGARSTQRLMAALIYNKSITTLIIDSCNISEEGAGHVGEALPDLKCLKTLQLASCGMGPIGCQRIFLGLAHNSSLTALDISGNQLTGYNFGEMNNQIDFELPAVVAISAGIGKNTTLQSLNLSNNRLFGLSQDRHVGTEGTLNTIAITEIARGIEMNGKAGGQLQVLNLLENRLSSTADNCWNCVGHYMMCLNVKLEWEATSFAEHPDVMNPQMRTDEYLRKNPQLLNETCSTCQGVEQVTELLAAAEAHPRLTSLLGITNTTQHAMLDSLRCCDQSMRILSAEISRSHTLQSVNLDNSDITVRGLHILLCGIRRSLVLKSVRLPLCDLGHKGTVLDEDSPSRLLEKAANHSFRYRISLALSIRALSWLGSAPCFALLEFCIGPGPMVEYFMGFRVVWTEWKEQIVENADRIEAEQQSVLSKTRRFGWSRPSLESPQPMFLTNDEGDDSRRKLTYAP